MNYQWLYFTEDYIGKINWEKLKKFYNSSFDYHLGWEPRPNTKKKESFGFNKIGFLSFDGNGLRDDPNKNFRETEFAIFGDSYALSRQVSSKETISHILGNNLNGYIPNYGVGNYGIDQAFQRYIKYRKNLSHKKIILIIVPETIVRMNTIWRHFHETGNIFGFKGKFFVENDRLNYQKNPIKEFSDYEKYLTKKITKNNLLANDPMFKIRFKKEVFDVKKLLKFEKETIVKAKEFCEFKLKSKYLKSINDLKGLSIRMKYNSKFTDLCYLNSKLTLPFELLIEEFNRQTKENLYIFFIPQLSDLNLKTNHCETYIDNLRKRKGYKIYSGFEYLQTKRHLVGKFNKLYVEDGYGGHLNKLGNVIISEWILDKL